MPGSRPRRTGARRGGRWRGARGRRSRTGARGSGAGFPGWWVPLRLWRRLRNAAGVVVLMARRTCDLLGWNPGKVPARENPGAEVGSDGVRSRYGSVRSPTQAAGGPAEVNVKSVSGYLHSRPPSSLDTQAINLYQYYRLYRNYWQRRRIGITWAEQIVVRLDAWNLPL